MEDYDLNDLLNQLRYFYNTESFYRYDREPVAEVKTCECGMEKHGFANHSTWCPKHE